MTAKVPPANKQIAPAMLVDTDQLFRMAKEGAAPFQQSAPFPHLLVPTFLKSVCCQAVYEGLHEWPPTPPGSFYPQQQVPSVMRLLLWELSSSTIIRHLSTLTGKPPLLPDPFLVRSGISTFHGESVTHVAGEEYFQRHPETQLMNVLRLETFVSSDPHATCWLELLDAGGKVATTHIATNGSALLMNSDHYHVRYQAMQLANMQPANWHSLIAYYYINDHARILNGQEQPRATY